MTAATRKGWGSLAGSAPAAGQQQQQLARHRLVVTYGRCWLGSRSLCKRGRYRRGAAVLVQVARAVVVWGQGREQAVGAATGAARGLLLQSCSSSSSPLS